MKKNSRPKWTWIIPLSASMFFLLIGGWTMVISCLFGLLWGNIGYDMMLKKRRDTTVGWALGFALGLVGLLIILCIKKKKE